LKQKNSGALVIAAMLDFLTYALCPPFSETTDGEHFDTLLGTLFMFPFFVLIRFDLMNEHMARFG
jgi:hypothetical protein